MQVKYTSAVAGSRETRIHSEFSDGQTHISSKTKKFDGQKLVKKPITSLSSICRLYRDRLKSAKHMMQTNKNNPFHTIMSCCLIL